MSPALLLLLALGLGLVGWLAARARAWSFRRVQPGGRLAALPSYHAWYVALWVVVLNEKIKHGPDEPEAEPPSRTTGTALAEVAARLSSPDSPYSMTGARDEKEASL